MPQSKQTKKFRLHVTPDAQLLEQSGREGTKLSPVILDSPNDPATTTGEMLRRLRDHVLPAGVEDMRLGVSPSGPEAEMTLLVDAQPLQEELEPWQKFFAYHSHSQYW